MKDKFPITGWIDPILYGTRRVRNAYISHQHFETSTITKINVTNVCLQLPRTPSFSAVGSVLEKIRHHVSVYLSFYRKRAA